MNLFGDRETLRRDNGLATELVPAAPVGAAPTLMDLSAEARNRLVRYIVSTTLERGAAPTAVIALYADLGGDELAVRYADQRFVLRQVPGDWQGLESRVLELEQDAHLRGVNLAAAWRRLERVSVDDQEPLEQLARLSGSRHQTRRTQRSIFDDPDDLDALDDDPDTGLHAALEGRLPDLVDLSDSAQQVIRRFAVEERLEHGLPPIELLDLYRTLELVGDDRARQYLDRVYVERDPPLDWLEAQMEAGKMMDLADMRGEDAGRLYADLMRGSPTMPPLLALQLLGERLHS